jgi:putative ABC transport system substrate-binding protein
VRRRAFLAAVALGLRAARVAAEQQTTKVHSLGLVAESPVLFGGALVADASAPNRDTWSFAVLTETQLDELERSLLIAAPGQPKREVTVRTTKGDAQLERAATELVRQSVDLLVTVGASATQAAAKATKTIPIVAVGVIDPVLLGLARSLGRPGGNVTGLSFGGAEWLSKGLELLAQASPRAHRISILANPSNPEVAKMVAATSATAQTLGVTITALSVERWGDMSRAVNAMVSGDPLLVVSDLMFVRLRTLILQTASKRKIPTMFQARAWVNAGGLMSYEPSVDEMQQRAMAYVDKLLGGARVSELPIELPTRFELTINLKTAKALGLTVPPSLLQRADQVIE